jgi:hypothetical protein
MNKKLMIINICALLLTSCGSVTSRVPAQAEDNTCLGVAHNFLPKDTVSFEDSKKLLKEKLALDLTDDQIADYFKYFQITDLNEKNADTLRSLFIYTSVDPDLRLNLLHDFSMINIGKDEKTKNWKQFQHHKAKVDAKKVKMIAKGGDDVFGKSELYEKLYYSCKTQVKAAPTAADYKQAKRLTYALAVGALGSNIVTYTYVHRDEEKNSKWYSELGFSLAITAGLSFTSGKFILANPNMTPWSVKMPMAYVTNMVTDAAITGGVYGSLFKAKNSDLEEKVNDLLSKPEKRAEVEELVKIANEKDLFEKYSKESAALLIDKKTNKPVNVKDFDREITIDDIDLDQSREIFMEALADKMYQENAGPLSTGSAAGDRYSYHRLYNLFSAPANIALSIMMYNQLCMTTNPNAGFLRAVGIYLGGSIIMDATYFETKKDLINQ